MDFTVNICGDNLSFLFLLCTYLYFCLFCGAGNQIQTSHKLNFNQWPILSTLCFEENILVLKLSQNY